MLRTGLRWLGRGLGVAVSGTAAVATYKYQTDPGMKRTMDFSYKIAPLCVAYAKASKEEYEELHKIYAPETLRIVLEMKG